MTVPRYLLVDEPTPGVRRLTLNRPDKRHALHNVLRGEIFAALREADGLEGWFGIWDLAKPVVAQVHGYCLAGGRAPFGDFRTTSREETS